MKTRALILSGGAFLGAVQIPSLKLLIKEFDYDYIYGTSIGALNGVYASHDLIDKLEYIWRSTKSPLDMLKPNILWPFQGLFSMEKIRSQLERDISLSGLKIPMKIGVTSFSDGQFYLLDTNDMTSDKELHDAILASACMAGIMTPIRMKINGTMHIVCDGGFRNTIPNYPGELFDEVDVITCTPIRSLLGRRNFGRTNILSILFRGLEIMKDEIYQQDFKSVKLLSNTNFITVYSPSENPGALLWISPKATKYRFRIGFEMIGSSVLI